MQGPKVGDLVHCRAPTGRLNLCRILRITTSRLGTMFQVEHIDLKIYDSPIKGEYHEKDVAWPVFLSESDPGQSKYAPQRSPCIKWMDVVRHVSVGCDSTLRGYLLRGIGPLGQ